MDEAVIDLVAPDDTTVVGELRVKCRPGRQAEAGIPLLVRLMARESLAGADSLALLEEGEYRYEALLPDIPSIRMEPVELFDPDGPGGECGRLRPGLNTGVVRVCAWSGNRILGSCELEVRSRKLGYVKDYRSMLSSIAQDSAEILLQRFAPADVTVLTPNTDIDARTLYQRFAFLSSLLNEPAFLAAVGSILRRPHESFDAEEESRPPGRGAPGGAALGRQLSNAGARTVASALRGPVDHLPSKLIVDQFSPTFNTEPNRFVRMAFETWRASCVALRDAMAGQVVTAPVVRGAREVDHVLDEIDGVLGHPAIRAAGLLTHFPIANQVLQKREGYRDVMRSFVQSEAAARLRWDGGEDVFRGGQRDVATLYEYWCYLQLARIVEGLCDVGFDRAELFELANDRIVLGLRRGKQRVLRGEVSRGGRRLVVELWFNRTFSRESWSREMRPDCSIRITMDPSLGRVQDSIWLHFDAKYRLTRSADAMASPDAGADTGVDESGRSTSRSTDLLKMHAYRDAIRRSAGAYVLYPGTELETSTLQEFEEIVPGIGAFPFRVGPDGNADDSSVRAVRSFLDGVLEHAANQASSYERSRYWADRSYEDGPVTLTARDFLIQPPADTLVLLGYVKSSNHLSWVLEKQLYNLRADTRTGSVGHDPALLGAELVVLYGPCLDVALAFRRLGVPQLLTRDEIAELGYPDPRGSLYCCLQLRAIDLSAEPIPADRVGVVQLRARPGAVRGEPIVVSWSELVGETPL